MVGRTILEFASETLAHCLHRPGRTHPADENHAPGRERQTAGRHDEARRQFRQPQTLAVLGRRLVPQPRVDMLRVDRLLQPRQLLTQLGRPLEQPWLEPAVEVFHTAVVLWHPRRDEHRFDAEAQAQPDHPRQGPRRWPPAGQFAGVVELDLGRPVQVLPALPEEGEDLVHAARAGQVKADGAVDGVLAHPDVIAVRTALEVDGPHQVDLVQLVGGPAPGGRDTPGVAAAGPGGPAARSSRCAPGRARWCARRAAGGHSGSSTRRGWPWPRAGCSRWPARHGPEAAGGRLVISYSARKQTALCNRKRVEINVDPLQQYPTRRGWPWPRSGCSRWPARHGPEAAGGWKGLSFPARARCPGRRGDELASGRTGPRGRPAGSGPTTCGTRSRRGPEWSRCA